MSHQADPDTIGGGPAGPRARSSPATSCPSTEWRRRPTGSSPHGTTRRTPAAPSSSRPRTRWSSAAAATTTGPSSGRAATSSRSLPSSTPCPSTSRRRRRWTAGGATRTSSTVGWSSSCGTSRADRAATSASTPASRSRARCWPPTSSTSRLVIAPTVVGSGQRLLDGLPPVRFETIRSTVSASGHLLVALRVVRS